MTTFLSITLALVLLVVYGCIGVTIGSTIHRHGLKNCTATRGHDDCGHTIAGVTMGIFWPVAWSPLIIGWYANRMLKRPLYAEEHQLTGLQRKVQIQNEITRLTKELRAGALEEKKALGIDLEGEWKE